MLMLQFLADVNTVSENLKRPLYRIDTSDLGMDTSKLECNLKTALDRCARWDAILLLDEADVFLEKRTSSNLTQNEMTTSKIPYSVVLTCLTFSSSFPSPPGILKGSHDSDHQPLPCHRSRVRVTYRPFVRLPGSGASLPGQDLVQLPHQREQEVG